MTYIYISVCKHISVCMHMHAPKDEGPRARYFTHTYIYISVRMHMHVQEGESSKVTTEQEADTGASLLGLF